MSAVYSPLLASVCERRERDKVTVWPTEESRET